jgi:hypothetical protein
MKTKTDLNLRIKASGEASSSEIYEFLMEQIFKLNGIKKDGKNIKIDSIDCSSSTTTEVL